MFSHNFRYATHMKLYQTILGIIIKETRSTGPHKFSLFTPITIIKGLLIKFGKKRPNRSTNNRDMAERAIRYVVRDGVGE